MNIVPKRHLKSRLWSNLFLCLMFAIFSVSTVGLIGLVSQSEKNNDNTVHAYIGASMKNRVMRPDGSDYAEATANSSGSGGVHWSWANIDISGTRVLTSGMESDKKDNGFAGLGNGQRAHLYVQYLHPGWYWSSMSGPGGGNGGKLTYLTDDTTTGPSDYQAGRYFDTGWHAQKVNDQYNGTNTFERRAFNISYSMSGYTGSSALSKTSATIYAWNTSTVTAPAAPSGYSFSGWYYGSTRLATSLALTHNGYEYGSTWLATFPKNQVIASSSSTSLEARYSINSYTLTAQTSDSAMGTVTPASVTYNYNTQVTLTASPTNTNRYQVYKWRNETTGVDLIVGNVTNYVFNIPAQATIIKVYFVGVNKTINIMAANKNTGGPVGTFTMTYSSQTYPSANDQLTRSVPYGTSVTLTATTPTLPKAITFLGWYSDAAGTGTRYSSSATYTFSVGDSGHTIYAVWGRQAYNVTVYNFILHSNGSTLRDYGYSRITGYAGDDITLQAGAIAGMEFKGWSTSSSTSYATSTAAIVSTSQSYTFTLTAAITYRALFTGTPYVFNYTAELIGGGTESYYTLNKTTETLYYQAPTTVTASAQTGFTFDGWYNTSGVKVSSTSALGLTAATYKGGTYIAKFTRNNYAFKVHSRDYLYSTLDASKYGAVSINDHTPTLSSNVFTYTIPYNTSITLNTTANEGFAYFGYVNNATTYTAQAAATAGVYTTTITAATNMVVVWRYTPTLVFSVMDTYNNTISPDGVSINSMATTATVAGSATGTVVYETDALPYSYKYSGIYFAYGNNPAMGTFVSSMTGITSSISANNFTINFAAAMVGSAANYSARTTVNVRVYVMRQVEISITATSSYRGSALIQPSVAILVGGTNSLATTATGPGTTQVTKTLVVDAGKSIQGITSSRTNFEIPNWTVSAVGLTGSSDFYDATVNNTSAFINVSANISFYCVFEVETRNVTLKQEIASTEQILGVVGNITINYWFESEGDASHTTKVNQTTVAVPMGYYYKVTATVATAYNAIVELSVVYLGTSTGTNVSGITQTMGTSALTATARYTYRSFTLKAAVSITNVASATERQNLENNDFVKQEVNKAYNVNINTNANNVDPFVRLENANIAKYEFKGIAITYNSGVHYPTGQGNPIDKGIGLSGTWLVPMANDGAGDVYKFVLNKSIKDVFEQMLMTTPTATTITITYIFEHSNPLLLWTAKLSDGTPLATHENGWGTSGEVGDVKVTVVKVSGGDNYTGSESLPKSTQYKLTVGVATGVDYYSFGSATNSGVTGYSLVTTKYTGAPWSQYYGEITFTTGTTANAVFEFTFTKRVFTVDVKTNLYAFPYSAGQTIATASMTQVGMTQRNGSGQAVSVVAGKVAALETGKYIATLSANITYGQAVSITSTPEVRNLGSINLMQFIGYYEAGGTKAITTASVFEMTSVAANRTIEARYVMIGTVTLSANPGNDLSNIEGALLLATNVNTGAVSAFLITNATTNYSALLLAGEDYSITLVMNVYYRAEFMSSGTEVYFNGDVAISLGNAGASFAFESLLIDATQDYAGSTIYI